MYNARTFQITRQPLIHSIEVERVSTQRASAGVTCLEPFQQTARVKQVLTCWTALGRKLFVGTDDGIANCALCLSLESSSDVLAPRREAVSYTSVLRQVSIAHDNFEGSKYLRKT